MLRSTPDLVRNGGFAKAFGDGAGDWEADPVHGWPDRLAPPPFDDAGLPHASFAARLSAQGCPALRQPVTVPGPPVRRFALRVTARATGEGGVCRLSAVSPRPEGSDHLLHQAEFVLTERWQRCRTVFEWTADGPCVIEIRAIGAAAIDVTDVRLVGLLDADAPHAVRFDTRGTMLLPSTRLRALMIEDYLHLLGWRTSINAGSNYDLLVCQKTTRFAGLLAARLRGRRVVYDLDDNEFAESLLTRARIEVFARLVDAVTAGSDVLRRRLSRAAGSVHLLENPVDVLDHSVVHGNLDWRGRLVWFGMPENAWMLAAAGITQPVVRITRGGDVPYDLRTIDQQLVLHDLALLPLALNDHTQAKNANRLVKCVGLGLPFLASDTPEHRRALEKLGLTDQVLVRPGQDWTERIAEVADDYAAFKARIVAARPVAFAAYGIEAVAAQWLAFCEGVMANERHAAIRVGFRREPE